MNRSRRPWCLERFLFKFYKKIKVVFFSKDLAIFASIAIIYSLRRRETSSKKCPGIPGIPGVNLKDQSWRHHMVLGTITKDRESSALATSLIFGHLQYQGLLVSSALTYLNLPQHGFIYCVWRYFNRQKIDISLTQIK